VETSISLLVNGRPQYKLLLHFNAFDFSHSQERLLCMCVFSLRTVNRVSDVWNWNTLRLATFYSGAIFSVDVLKVTYC